MSMTWQDQWLNGQQPNTKGHFHHVFEQDRKCELMQRAVAESTSLIGINHDTINTAETGYTETHTQTMSKPPSTHASYCWASKPPVVKAFLWVQHLPNVECEHRGVTVSLRPILLTLCRWRRAQIMTTSLLVIRYACIHCIMGAANEYFRIPAIALCIKSHLQPCPGNYGKVPHCIVGT